MDRQVRAWCLYDVANSAFTTTIVAAVLPRFFSAVAGADLDQDPERARVLATGVWGQVTVVTMVLNAIAAPLLGTWADAGGGYKRLMSRLVVVGALATAALVLVGRGDWLLASTLFVVGNLAWSGSLVLYDGLLPHVAAPGEADRVSARGFAWGYLGGGLLLAAQLGLILSADRLGISSLAATRIAFVSVAVWWLAFTVPLLRHVREPRVAAGGASLAETVARLRATLSALRAHRAAWLFLIAFWLYNDGISTIVRMAVIFGAELGLGQGTLMGALLLVQVLGFPFSLAFGRMAGRIGTRPAIYVGLAGYTLLCVFAFFLQTGLHFWLLAVGVSMFQGGTQALSRSLFSSMIPAERSGEFFGFYNLGSKFSGLIGSAMFAAAGPWFGSSRYGVLALIVLFVAGGVVLSRVRPEVPTR